METLNLTPSDLAGNSGISPLLRRTRSDQENTPPLPINHPNVHRTTKLSKTLSSLEIPACISHSPSRDEANSVKVVVRVRPVNRREREGVRIVHKDSSASLSVEGQTFQFDSVLGPDSSQEDVFKSVGVPLVENSLAGFNTTVLSYGQTGSGKTYTMWGPPSAMLDGRSINSYQGLVPRIFQMLFSEIQNKQESSEEKQVNYQCRCSFLEIYNEQINDLLDPTQRNLQIQGDLRGVFNVENLTDEYVTTIEDVTQILVKGLSNRKVGATSVNSKSSRSHIMFTCILESWCKGSSSIFSSSKSSRISLVDLAGIDTDKLDGVGKHCLKEDKHIKHSLSKLGKVVTLLATVSQPGKDENIPYKDSCLTHLLQDTLGGNAKVTFICAISPNDRHKAGTLSTLRFGERARLVQSKATINEITEDDVNGLSDQIRQLKEELIREKSYGATSASNYVAYFKGKKARESLNLLRVSLNRSLILPHIDNDSKEELVVDEEDITELCSQLTNLHSSDNENSEDIGGTSPSEVSVNAKLDKDVNSCLDSLEVDHSLEDIISEEVHGNKAPSNGIALHSDMVSPDATMSEGNDQPQGSPRQRNISIVPCERFPLLQDPPICLSPKIDNLKENTVMPSDVSFCEVPSSEKMDVQKRDSMRSSLQSSKISATESLAASLHRGLQIIDYHQRNSPTKRSLLGLSFDHLALSCRSVDKVDARAQTSPENKGRDVPLLCSACKNDVLVSGNTTHVNANLDMQIVEVNDAGTAEVLKKDMLKEDDVILANAIKSKMELESLCAEQAATIRQLTCLVDHCKREHSQSSTTEQGQAAMILRLEDSADQKTSFDMSEREALIQEIQDLKNQLKSCTDVSASISLLDQIRNGSSSPNDGDIEKERQRWTECESRWISLTEELRLDLESSRRLAERKEIELSLEKKCTAELDDALQRSILGHARIIEHYAELQENYGELLGRHRKVMEGIAEVKKAATRAGSKGTGKAFVNALAAELSTLRIEREREREYLKKQNRGLRIQLRDTAEAVHAAGELLVRLKEAEEAVSVSEEKYEQAQHENDKLRKQVERMKKKHAMEMVTMKHYLAESRLPDSALEPLYHHQESNAEERRGQSADDDDQSWRAAFTPSYQ